LNIPGGRVEFARQLYNFLSVLGAEGEVTTAPVQRLKEKITDHRSKYGMKSLMTNKSKTKDSRESDDESDDDDASTGAGGGGASAADSEDLRAHGYEVKSDVIVDNKGGTFEPFFKVWRQFCTYYTLY
jgi:hypothetical protein